MTDQRGSNADVSAKPAKVQGDDGPFDALLSEIRWHGATEPRKAAEAVLCAMSRRLSEGDLEGLEGVLPQNVQELIRPCERHQGVGREQRLDREEFMADVADHLGMQPEQVESLVYAVFTALRDQIPDEDIVRVASQLPSDMADLLRRPV